MAYNKFTLNKVKKQFGITLDSRLSMFCHINGVEINSRLSTLLADFAPLAVAIDTEKARSEWIIAPILGELRLQLIGKMSLFSGINFQVDPKQQLTGFCDFIISHSPDQLDLGTPVVMIAEAKNDNVMKGLGQAIAMMIAAQIFNQTEQHPREVIYGAVTTGTDWKFLKLVGQTVYVDADDYYLRDLDKIMAILIEMVTN